MFEWAEGALPCVPCNFISVTRLGLGGSEGLLSDIPLGPGCASSAAWVWKWDLCYSIFILAKPRGERLTAELAALLLKTLREKSNPKNMPETNSVFCRLALRVLFFYVLSSGFTLQELPPRAEPSWGLKLRMVLRACGVLVARKALSG